MKNNHSLPEEVLINLARTENLNDDERNQLLQLLCKGLDDEDAAEFLSIVNGEKLPPLSSDIIAKKIFDPEEHPERLTYLLQGVTGETIEVSGASQTECPIRFVDSKKLIYDLAADLDDGRKSDTEFQVRAQDFIFPRTDLYASDLLMLQYSAKKGEKGTVTYDNVKGVIVVVLMCESPAMFKDFDNSSSDKDDKDIHRNWYIHRFRTETAESGLCYVPLAERVYVQLDKAYRQFKEGIDGQNNKKLQLLLSAIKNINDPVVQEQMKQDSMFSGILSELILLSQDKEVQIMLLAEKYAMSDIATMRKADEAKGRLEQAKQVYDNCIARGMSVEDANALSGYADLLSEQES